MLNSCFLKRRKINFVLTTRSHFQQPPVISNTWPPLSLSFQLCSHLLTPYCSRSSLICLHPTPDFVPPYTSGNYYHHHHRHRHNCCYPFSCVSLPLQSSCLHICNRCSLTSNGSLIDIFHCSVLKCLFHLEILLFSSRSVQLFLEAIAAIDSLIYYSLMSIVLMSIINLCVCASVYFVTNPNP